MIKRKTFKIKNKFQLVVETEIVKYIESLIFLVLHPTTNPLT